MKRLNLLVVLLLLLCSSFAAHKYYISITQINYVPEQNSLQIISRIFIDDLQNELNTSLETDIELATDREPKNVNDIYRNYLQKKLSFIINNSLIHFEYIGSEYENDQVVFYLEISNIPTLKKLEVGNQILTSSFEEQKNIIKFHAIKQNKSFILNASNPKCLINF
ncbi:DUF6702 family protein [Bacteroidota bacterium]